MEFFTIGAYNSEEEEFFNKLDKHNIDTFLDVRQHRGVRGARYSYVNSNRLQSKLQKMAIRYHHIPGLAPTPEIRAIQDKTDKQQKKSKKERTQLSADFITAYEQEIAGNFDFEGFLKKLDEQGAKRIVLFCVEEYPEACHRSLATRKLNELGYKITHM